jgi:hypothetical protein
MGQQQLLLIVLGVIIVGVAVVIGIKLFTASAYNAEIDKLTNEALSILSMAKAHYLKPVSMGGGGHKFVGWTPPTYLTDGNPVIRTHDLFFGTDILNFTSKNAKYTFQEADLELSGTTIRVITITCNSVLYHKSTGGSDPGSPKYIYITGYTAGKNQGIFGSSYHSNSTVLTVTTGIN